MVSKVLGDTLNRKVFSNLFLVIGSAVSEISQFVHFYVKARESQYLGNGSSNHQKSIPKKLYTKYPYRPRILPFWIQSLLIPTYWTTLKDRVAFAELSHVKNCSVIKDILCSLRKQVTKLTQYIFW